MVKKNLENKSAEAIDAFRMYAKGIARLRELENELNSLDKSGFEKEANSIGKKLRDISLIPNIESELKNLKLKIKEKDSARKIQEKEQAKKIEEKIKLEKKKIIEKPIEVKEEKIVSRVNLPAGVKEKEEAISKNELERFRAYASGVKRLHELESELNSLDTREFKNEEQKIRENLKKVSMISVIEKQIGELRIKIEKSQAQKNIPAPKVSHVSGISEIFKKFKIKNVIKPAALEKEAEQEVAENQRIDDIKKRIFTLQKEIEKAENLARKKQVGKKEVKQVSAIPSIKARIHRLEIEIERPEFYNRRKLFEKKLTEHFESYSTGVIRLKELEQELDDLDKKGLTKGFKIYEDEIRKKLKEVALVPQIEQEIKELKLRIAGIDVDYRKSLVDKTQNRKISHLKSSLNANFGKDMEQQNEIRDMSTKMALLENDLKIAKDLAGKKSLDMRQLSEIKGISLIKRKISLARNLLENRSARLEAEMDALNMETVHRLNFLKAEINSLEEIIPNLIERLDVAEVTAKKEKVNEIEIRVLKNNLDSLKDDFGISADELKKEIIGVKSLLGKKQLSLSDLKAVERIPDIERTLEVQKMFFEGKLIELEKKLGSLPDIKKPIESLRDSFAETSESLRQDIANIKRTFTRSQIDYKINFIAQKIDENKVEFNSRLIKELAESRRMIENEKAEIREQLLDVLAESMKQIKKEKELSDKRILSEINFIKLRVDDARAESDKSTVSKIVELQKKIEESRNEINDSIKKELSDIKNKVRLEILKKNTEEKMLADKFEKLEEKQIDMPKIRIIPVTLPQRKPAEAYVPWGINSEIQPNQPLKAEIVPGRTIPEKVLKFFSEKESKPIKIQSFKAPAKIDAKKLSEVRNELRAELPENNWKDAEIESEIPKKKKIPAKAYFEHSEFLELSRNVSELKDILENDYEIISEDLKIEEELNNVLLGDVKKELEKITGNLSKAVSDMFGKKKIE